MILDNVIHAYKVEKYGIDLKFWSKLLMQIHKFMFLIISVEGKIMPIEHLSNIKIPRIDKMIQQNLSRHNHN